MDFIMTDEELDGYLVLIRFMLKKKKSLPSKKSKRFWVREIFKERAAYELYNNLMDELKIGDREGFLFQVNFSNDISAEVSKLYE